MSDDLKNIVEAVLLASDGPVNVVRIQSLFDDNARPEASRVHEAIEALQAECEDRGIELRKIGSGYRYQTQEKYAEYLRKLHTARPPRMSRALLETLAIIAYRQPVTRGDIEEVRGVTVSSEIMQRLVEREWVREVGVRDVPGRPALFGTTPEFLSYFNLTSLKDLPDLMAQRALGEIAGEMETPMPPELLEALEAGANETVQVGLPADAGEHVDEEKGDAALEEIDAALADISVADDGESTEISAQSDDSSETESEADAERSSDSDSEAEAVAGPDADSAKTG